MSTDYDKVRNTAAAEVDTALAGITDARERRARADAIREQANAELPDLKRERDRLVAAAALAEGRVTKELSDAAGMSFVYAQKIAAAHNAAHVPAGWRWSSPEALEEARARDTLHQDPDIRARAIDAARRFQAAVARRDAARAHLNAAHTAVRAGGRVQVTLPAAPDFTEIRRKAAEEINAEFATLAAGPEDRLRRAADTVDQAEDEMALLKTERNQAVASLAFYTTARSIHRAAGMSRQGYLRIVERALGLPHGSKLPPHEEQPDAARAAGVPFVADAADELAEIAAVYEAAEARRDAALEIRAAAMRALAAEPYGWSQRRIAAFIGRDAATVNRALNSAA